MEFVIRIRRPDADVAIFHNQTVRRQAISVKPERAGFELDQRADVKRRVAARIAGSAGWRIGRGRGPGG